MTADSHGNKKISLKPISLFLDYINNVTTNKKTQHDSIIEVNTQHSKIFNSNQGYNKHNKTCINHLLWQDLPYEYLLKHTGNSGVLKLTTQDTISYHKEIILLNTSNY